MNEEVKHLMNTAATNRRLRDGVEDRQKADRYNQRHSNRNR
jgi:hypothetical protein